MVVLLLGTNDAIARNWMAGRASSGALGFAQGLARQERLPSGGGVAHEVRLTRNDLEGFRSRL